MVIQYSLPGLQSLSSSSFHRLSDMEVLILYAFSKPFYYESRVLDGGSYPICDLEFIRSSTTHLYNSRILQCSEASKAKQYLEQYLSRYEQGILSPSLNVPQYCFKKSIVDTVQLLQTYQQTQGDRMIIQQKAVSAAIPQAHWVADLLYLQKTEYVDVIPVDEYESSEDFAVTIVIKGNLQRVLPALNLSVPSKQCVVASKGILKMMDQPYEVLYGSQRVPIKNNTNEMQVLKKLLKSSSYQYSLDSLGKNLYGKALSQKTTRNRLKSVRIQLNKKLGKAGCPWKIHQITDTTGITYLQLK